MIRLSPSIISRGLSCLVVLLLLHGRVGAATPADYDRLLSTTSQDLQRAVRMEKAAPGSGVPVLKSVETRLRQGMKVSAGGQIVRVDLAGMAAHVRRARTSPGKQRLAALADLQQAMESAQAAASGHSAEQANVVHGRQIVRSIISGADFQPTWQERLGMMWRRALVRVLSGLDIPPGAAKTIGWVIIALLIIGFASLLIMLWIKLAPRYFKRLPEGKLQTINAGKPRKPTFESLLAAAEHDASLGEYREAFRNGYLASVLLLDRARFLTYVDSSTNWEYLRSLRQQERREPAEVFQDMTMLFDRLIYGKREVTRDDYLACRRQLQKLEAMF